MSTFFRDAPFGMKQRICFWAAFLYYMASAATLITAVLPSLIMLWGYPEEIVPRFYLPVIPAILATFFVFPRIARGWNINIFRVSMINSFCHVLAVTDALRNQVRAWIPTGAVGGVKRSNAKAGTPERIAAIGRIWFVFTQGLLWIGIARFGLSGGDLLNIWPMFVLAGAQLYFLAPLLITLKPASQRRANRALARAWVEEPNSEVAAAA
jgi:cellulose synthase (UDP-forming)